MKQIQKHSLGHTISTCNNKMIKNLNRSLSKNSIDLTREQYVVLRMLWDLGSLNQQQLADKLDKDKFSITKLIDGLENRKLVKRVASENDRRIKIIEVTEKAMQIKTSVEDITREALKQSIEGISTEEISTFESVLLKITKNLS